MDIGVHFTQPRLRALLDGRLTEAWYPAAASRDRYHGPGRVQRYYLPGDRIFCKEEHYTHLDGSRWDARTQLRRWPEGDVLRRAEDPERRLDVWRWSPPKMMPRWAATAWALIDRDRMTTLQAVTGADALASGIAEVHHWREVEVRELAAISDTRGIPIAEAHAIVAFMRFWESLYHDKPLFRWAANPPVQVIYFHPIAQPPDRFDPNARRRDLKSVNRCFGFEL